LRLTYTLGAPPYLFSLGKQKEHMTMITIDDYYIAGPTMGNRGDNPVRTIALGLLSSGIPVRAGECILYEPRELSLVPTTTVLTTLDGRELCDLDVRLSGRLED
jgi:hypothetical protein